MKTLLFSLGLLSTNGTFSDGYGPQLMARIAALPGELENRIVGQRALQETWVNLANQAFSGIQSGSSPAIRLLISGPTNVDKTESARAYAESMGFPFRSIEMRRFKDKGVEELFAELASILGENPRTVIALEDVEMASPRVQAMVIVFLKSGFFEFEEEIGGTKQRKRYSAKEAAMVGTTSAGDRFVLSRDTQIFGFRSARALRDLDLRNLQDPIFVEELRNEILEKGVSAQLLSAFPTLVAALPPNRQEFRDMLQVHLRKTVKSQAANGLFIEISNEDEFIEGLTVRYFRDNLGSRISNDIIQKHFLGALSQWLVKNGRPANGRLMLALSPSSQNNVASCQNELELLLLAKGTQSGR